MKEQNWLQIHDVMKVAAEMLYHITVVVLSAWGALSLPRAAETAGQIFAAYWPALERDKAAMVSFEVALALLLMVCLNYVRRSIQDRKLAAVATYAGITNVFSIRSSRTKNKIRRLKMTHGRAKHLMILGSTGYNTLVDPRGDLHTVIWKCLEAKVMLLNPCSDAARMRVNAIHDPKITHENVAAQVMQSIELCRRLKAGQKSVRLKLYSDPPHVKLAILGSMIWLQHYHTGLDVHMMPEYLVRQNQHDYGLYTLFYQYFTARWESPEVPEYDLETDELVYRGINGAETRREPFPLKVRMAPTAASPLTNFRDMGLQDR